MASTKAARITTPKIMVQGLPANLLNLIFRFSPEMVTVCRVWRQLSANLEWNHIYALGFYGRNEGEVESNLSERRVGFHPPHPSTPFIALQCRRKEINVHMAAERTNILLRLSSPDKHFDTLSAAVQEGAKSVKELSLQGLCLSHIPQELRGLERLQSWNLSGNHLSYFYISEGSFAWLRHLDLSHNNLTAFPDFPSLYSMRVLILDHNPLGQLSDRVGQLRRLTQLSCRGCDLTYISPVIEKCIHLTILDLGNNRLSYLPRGFWNCSSLTTLSLDINAFQELCIDVGLLRNLRELILAHNKLQELPSNMELLHRLTSLNVEGNHLSAFPPLLENRALRSLNLKANRLTHLPDEISTLDRLEHLDCTNNPLMTRAPSSLKQMTTLKHIEFDFEVPTQQL